MNSNPLDEASEELLDLIADALDHGFDSIKDSGGPLIPFVILDHGDRKELRRMMAEDSDAAISHARRVVGAAPASVQRYAFAYDAFLRINNTRKDAIIVMAGERALRSSVTLYPCYSPLSTTAPGLQRDGDVGLIGHGESFMNSDSQ